MDSMVNLVSCNKNKFFWLPDVVATIYFIGITAFFYLYGDTVAQVTKAYPYPTGFVKFALLATFGECLKNRLVASRWWPGQIVGRMMLWGAIGIWLSVAFPLIDGGVRAIVAEHLWPGGPLMALWMSLWANIFVGYGAFMMFTHYWLESMLTEGWVWPWEMLGRPGTARWGKIVVISYIYWIPAHVVTFLLPPVWRILFLAYVSISLGLILSFAAKKS